MTWSASRRGLYLLIAIIAILLVQVELWLIRLFLYLIERRTEHVLQEFLSRHNLLWMPLVLFALCIGIIKIINLNKRGLIYTWLLFWGVFSGIQQVAYWLAYGLISSLIFVGDEALVYSFMQDPFSLLVPLITCILLALYADRYDPGWKIAVTECAARLHDYIVD